jgi:hypothetical protein
VYRETERTSALTRLAWAALALTLGELAASAGEDKMALNVAFKIDKTDFLIQESPPCLLTLTNIGPKSLEVLNPARSFSTPVIRVIDLKTGAETLCRRKVPRGEREREITLAPGKSTEHAFELLEQAVLPAPGAYELSVLYKYNDGLAEAESEPVRVNVRPNTARNLMLVSANGGPGAILYGASINVTSEPPEIVRSGFTALRGGGVDQVHAVGPATIRSIPILSEPQREVPVESHWIAWLQGGELQCLHFDPQLGATPANKLKLPGPNAEIVPPLYTAPAKDPKVRPNGGVLLCLTDLAGTACRLQRIDLTPKDAKLGPTVDVAGPRPVWLKSHTRSTGIRLVTYVQAAAQSASLWKVVWPDPAAGTTPPRKLTEWSGEFIAAGSALLDDDSIGGGVLMWIEKDGQRKLMLRSWRTVKDEVSTGPELEIPWDPGHTVERAQLRVNVDAAPAVLLREPEGPWQLFFEGSLNPVKGAFSTTNLPIEIVFLEGVEPMFLCAQQELGFKFVMPDGRPLPPQRR